MDLTNHVIQRAKERLNLNLSEFDCELIAKMIRDGECESIHKPWFAVKFHNRIFKVCYSNKRKIITTVLPIT